MRYTFEDGPANGNTTFTDVTGHGYNGTFTGNGDLTLGLLDRRQTGNLRRFNGRGSGPLRAGGIREGIGLYQSVSPCLRS